jgi:hypothetical protein
LTRKANYFRDSLAFSSTMEGPLHWQFSGLGAFQNLVCLS